MNKDEQEQGAKELKRRAEEGPSACPRCGNQDADKREMGVDEDEELYDVCMRCGHQWKERLQ